MRRIKLYFCLDQAYRPTHSDYIWIEHGHQYDVCNSFFVGKKSFWSASNPPILIDKEGIQRILECIGTRFLNKFLNKLDRDYPMVDNVKPFSRFVSIFLASVFVPGFGPVRATVAAWEMLRFLASTLGTTPRDLLSAEGPGAARAGNVLRAWANGLPPEAKEGLSRRMHERGFWPRRSLSLDLADENDTTRLLEFFARDIALLEPYDGLSEGTLGGADGSGTLALYQGFHLNETEELRSKAWMIIEREQAEIVVMGHTHETVVPPQSTPFYLNPGSWTRNYRFSEHECTRAWRLLRSQSYSAFPYYLNYVRIPSGRPQDTELVTYRTRDNGQ
jgi:hypothetical protein